jgi:hypothetical protein
MINGTRESWTGSWKRPQYHEISVNMSRDALNDTGNAKFPNAFFNEG